VLKLLPLIIINSFFKEFSVLNTVLQHNRELLWVWDDELETNNRPFTSPTI